MIRNLKIKFVLIIMLLLTIVLTTLLAGLFMYQKNQLYVDSVNAMKEAMVLQADTQSSLYYELFGLYSRSSRYPYFNTFVLEVDRIDKTVTAIGYEEELDDEKKEYLLSLVNAVPAVNNAEGILPAENLRYYVNTTSRGVKIAFLDKEYEDASLRDLLKNSLWIVSLSLFGFLVISLIMTKIATAPVEKSWKQQKQLVADMSHELKTPLTVISANADIVLANRDSTVAEQEKWLVYIRQETERMTKLINEMLYLAKHDDGRAEEEMVPFDLSEAAESCTLPFESVCFENGVQFYTEIQPGLNMLGSPSAIKQVMMILLDNAVKYAGENGFVRFFLHADGDRVTLSVNNTGESIPPELIPHIFERFYRVDESRARDKGGYGLGLSIAKSIVDRHGGRITVKSDAETGSTFTCTFKRYKKHLNETRPFAGDDGEKDREGRLRVVPLSLSSFAARLGRAVFRYPLQLVLDFFKRAFFQTAHLRLRDADFVGDLRLRPSVVEAQREDAPLALAELADGLRDGDFVQPLIVGVLVVLDLVQHIDRVAVVRIDRLVERNRVGDGIQRVDHLVFRPAQLFGNLGVGRLAR
mgnify:CR=1 FL=1